MRNTWNLRLWNNVVFSVVADMTDEGVIVKTINGAGWLSLYPIVKQYLNSDRFAEDLEYYFESDFLMNQELELHPDGKGDFYLAI